MARLQIIRVIGALVLIGSSLGATAQVLNSGASTIALNATLTESVSVTLSANAVNFTLAAGSASNPGSTSVTATTVWTLKPSRGSLNVYGFQISDNGGAFTALTSTVPFGGASAGLQLATVKIIGNNKQGSRTDNMNFNINLSALPTLPAGTYTGTVTIQVQVI
jgi:hypothetical protein